MIAPLLPAAPMHQLREYQSDAISALWKTFREKPNAAPLIVCPTGGGKSLLIASVVQKILDSRPNYRIVVLAHRKELVEQNSEELRNLLPNESIGIYSAGLGQKKIRRVTFANIQSIAKRRIPCDAVIVDECHLIPGSESSQYKTFLNGARPKAVIGFTATPFRMDQGHLLDGDDAIFTDIAHETTIRQLIELGYLSPLVSKVAKGSIDTRGVRTSGADFRAQDLYDKFSPLTEMQCAEIIEKASDRKSWLIFASTVEHAFEVSRCLENFGIDCAVITGETPAGERASVIQKFKRREIRCVINVAVLTTGFNAPGIDALILMRSTKSLSLYIQMVGRGTRLAPGKDDCLVLDFGANIERHGPIDQIEPKKVGDKVVTEAPPSKICPQCGMVLLAFARACTECGFEFLGDGREKKLLETASTASILAEPEEFSVIETTYALHQSEGKPDMLRVDMYYDRWNKISDFFCFDHDGSAAIRAWHKWKAYAVDPSSKPPRTTGEAVERASELANVRTVSAVKVKKFWRIVSIQKESRAA